MDKQEQERRSMMHALIDAFKEMGCEVVGMGNYSFYAKMTGVRIVVCTENISSDEEVEFTTAEGINSIKIGQGDYKYLDAATEILRQIKLETEVLPL